MDLTGKSTLPASHRNIGQLRIKVYVKIETQRDRRQNSSKYRMKPKSNPINSTSISQRMKLQFPMENPNRREPLRLGFYILAEAVLCSDEPGKSMDA